jgi:3D-(3,5/4)-trihydroxycyclohexane-1,2-dione acylhydrolase (decyclizing)
LVRDFSDEFSQSVEHKIDVNPYSLHSFSIAEAFCLANFCSARQAAGLLAHLKTLLTTFIRKMAKTTTLTSAQAVVLYLQHQYSDWDGDRQRLIPGMFGIFGHGNVAGLGQALEEYGLDLPFYQAKNEQSMVHAAIGFAKAKNRRSTLACTASIGPGSTNMLTGAATATVNRIPVLLLPSDIFANRRPGNVLQQLEHPLEGDVTVNDAFRPLSRFFDRISRPEQLLTALPEAMRVLTDPAETGAVTICLPQDVQGESCDFPTSFFEDSVWKIRRRPPCAEDIAEAVAAFSKARRPLLIAGGGVRYAEAEAALVDFANQFGVPVMETHAGKGVGRGARHLLGGGGLNGTGAAAQLSEQADLVLCVGTRLDDFVTASRSAFQHPDVTFISINVNSFDAHKLGTINIVADAKLAVAALSKELNRVGFVTSEAYQTEAVTKVIDWRKAYLNSLGLNEAGWMSQGGIIHLVNDAAKADDVVIAAAGTPPGEILKGWDNEAGEQVLLEFGFSCMGHEIPAGLGVRLACPNKGEIFVIIGDGTYLMAPSELVTAVQENLKITVVLIENSGYQCIRDLQQSTTGSQNFGNEFRKRPEAGRQLNGDYVEVDYPAITRGMGCRTFAVQSPNELRQALLEAREVSGPAVIVVKADKHSKSKGAGLWWDLGIAETSGLQRVQTVYRDFLTGRRKQRVFTRNSHHG